MSAPIHLERRWIMDTFGNFLQFSSMPSQLIKTPFTPQSFPNLFTFVPVPENYPHRAILRLLNSIPSSIPPAQFVRINEDEIAIKDLETQRYLCSILGNHSTSWHAEAVNDWEHFMLVNKEMLDSLSALSDSDIAVCRLNDEIVSNLVFTGNANTAKLGDIEIKIAQNLKEIAKLATAPAHQPIELSLKTSDETQDDLKVSIVLNRSL